MQLIAHSDRVYSINSFLTASQCDALIADAEQHGFGVAGVRTTEGQKMMQNIRNNERAQYPSEPWVALLWECLNKVPLLILAAAKPIFVTSKLAHKKALRYCSFTILGTKALRSPTA